MPQLLNDLRENPASTFKIASSYGIGMSALFFCFLTAWTYGTDGYLQVLLCIFGGALGWILGLYITPTTESEKQVVSEYGKAFAALVSGFGLAQIASAGEALKALYQGDTSGVTALRLLLFGCCFLIGALFTYVSRLHVRDDDEDKLQADRLEQFGKAERALAELKRLSDRVTRARANATRERPAPGESP